MKRVAPLEPAALKTLIWNRPVKPLEPKATAVVVLWRV
jgi:hypothetical protein